MKLEFGTEILIPDSIEPYIAYKALRVSNMTLKSPSRLFVWPARERAEAKCYRGMLREGEGHLIAAKPCSCGIYAVPYEERYKLRGYFQRYHVVVRVAMWGRITIGQTGARAQYAYPQEIVAWTCSTQRARKIAELYGMGIVMSNPGREWLKVQQEEAAA